VGKLEEMGNTTLGQAGNNFGGVLGCGNYMDDDGFRVRVEWAAGRKRRGSAHESVQVYENAYNIRSKCDDRKKSLINRRRHTSLTTAHTGLHATIDAGQRSWAARFTVG
jgi:hypothetical protein